MPSFRRPSASAGAISNATSSTTAASSSSRIPGAANASAKAGSNHAVTQSQSASSLGSLVGSHQQKIIQVLVNRIKHKLPCNSGTDLAQLEADQVMQQTIEALIDQSRDSLDYISWCLCEQLDNLTKRADTGEFHSIEILQSQLFLLKVLAAAMGSRWSSSPLFPRPQSRTSRPNSPLPSKRSRGPGSIDHSSTTSPSPWSDLPPIDDTCAKYMLSVMSLFLRQTSTTSHDTASLLARSHEDISFRDYEALDLPENGGQGELEGPYTQGITSHTGLASSGMSIQDVVASSATSGYEKTHMSLTGSVSAVNALIAKFTGRVIFHLSASNWNVVWYRLRQRITSLANDVEGETSDLLILAHSVLDKTRISQVLVSIPSLVLNMTAQTVEAIAIPLRIAIFNWIDHFPNEFQDVARGKSKLDSAPRQCLDAFLNICEPGRDLEPALWPVMNVLHTLFTTNTTLQMPGGRATKANKFTEAIVRAANTPSKLTPLTLITGIDTCRIAMHVNPDFDSSLRLLATDIAEECKTHQNSGHVYKPFWELTEDIDIALFAEILVLFFRFLPEEESLPFFRTCIEPERSEAIKTVVIRACLTLIQEAKRFPWQRPLDNLADVVGPRFRDIYNSAGLRQSEHDPNTGGVRRVSRRPAGKRTVQQPLSDREVMLLGILSVWRASPKFVLLYAHNDSMQWTKTFARVVETSDPALMLSTAAMCNVLGGMAFTTPSDDPLSGVLLATVKAGLPSSLLCVSSNLLQSRSNPAIQRLWISVAIQTLERYQRKSEYEHTKVLQLDPQRVPVLLVAELAFNVCLTSVDTSVVRLAALGLRMLSHVERQPGAPVPPYPEAFAVQRRQIYEQLGDPKIMVIGRVGQQKRMRKLLRILPDSHRATGAGALVWQECYWRWKSLTEAITQSMEGLSDAGIVRRPNFVGTVQEQRHQWQNLTLHLAAMANIGQDDPENSFASLLEIIPPMVMPDKLRTVGSPTEYVRALVNELVCLLTSEDIHVRDTAREALGTELGPGLYSRLLKHIEDICHDLAKAQPSEARPEWTAICMDQFLSVVKMIVDNESVRPNEILAIEVSSTLTNFATLISRLVGSNAFRIKVKFCALAESVCGNTGVLTMRKDSPARHHILGEVVSWIRPPEHLHKDLLTAQVDLNVACLRTCVKLLERLALRPIDDVATGDDASHTIQRLFGKYMNILLDGLELCLLDLPEPDSVSELGSLQQKMRVSRYESEVRELVITGLANLVSANADPGFKQCLPLAYHPEYRKRLIFARAFAKVIGQGTKFDPEVKSVNKSSQSKLVELVKQPDMSLALAICETCPATEVDQIISVMLTLFNTRSSLMHLMKELVTREVANTESDLNFFRANTTCTRFLSAFARIHGYTYLRSLVKPLITIMEDIPTGYELNPQYSQEQNLDQNQQSLQFVAEKFMDIILQSVSALPPMFHELSLHIVDAVGPRWPESRYTCLGAFIFLRFISPVIVAPEGVDLEIPNESIRRGLLLIAKIIQNLANNVMFGREVYMSCLNPFLQQHGSVMYRFFNSVLHLVEDTAEYNEDEWTGTPSEESDSIILHRFCNRNADKIGKELLSTPNTAADGDASIHGKQAWDNLCTLLVDLGQPFDVPRPTKSISSEHEGYNALMAACEGMDTSAMSDLFFEVVQSTRDADALFILRLAKLDLDTLDFELFMYHILKALSRTSNNNPFDLIVDCTEFSPSSEIPLRWLKFCAEMAPADIRDRFQQTFVLNPNTLAQRYLKRLYNVSSGAAFCGSLTTCSSISDLVAQYPHVAHAVEHLQETFDLEKSLVGSRESFNDVTVRLGEQTSYYMPSRLSIGPTHIRIVTQRTQPVSPNISCKAVEFIALNEIGDVYRTTTSNTRPNEFILRHTKTGSNVFLTSLARDEIIRAVRGAKSRLKDSKTTVAERFARFSNVPAAVLQVALQNLFSFDEELRAAAFDLLGAVCTYLNYDKSPIAIPHTAGIVTGDMTTFAVGLSAAIAEFAPALTMDFGAEVMCALGTMTTSGPESEIQRSACIQYISPWLKNLNLVVQAGNPLYERSGSRMRDSFRMMFELCVQYPELTVQTQQHIWQKIGSLDSAVLDIAIDELVRAAIDAGIGSSRCERIAQSLSAFRSISVRGRLIWRLRKAIIKASPSPARSFADSAFWGEVSTLVRLTLLTGPEPESLERNRLFLPEIVHIVSIVAGLGSTLVRKSVHSLIMNILQSLYISRSEDSPAPGLSGLIRAITTDSLHLFGLQRPYPTSEFSSWDPPNDKATIDNQERLVLLLRRILECAAGTTDLLNVWRARWLSLATASAFQHFSVVQMRSFTSLASLANSNVDDDYCYQMLVAFRSALGHVTETNTLAIVCMLRAFTKIIPGLPEKSNHRPHLFWLSVAFLQSSHIAFYAEAASLLCVTIEDMAVKGYFNEEKDSVHNVLLRYREDIDEVASELDSVLGLSCNSYFSFALAPVVFKGARYSGTQDMAKKTLETLVGVFVRAARETASESGSGSGDGGSDASGGSRLPRETDALDADVLGYFLALLPFTNSASTYRKLLKECGLDERWLPQPDIFEDDNNIPHISPILLGITDNLTALLATSFISGILSSAQGDDAETEILFGLLSQISVIYPDVVAMAYDSLQDRIKDCFANSTNAAIIGHISEILRVASYEQSFSSPVFPTQFGSRRSINQKNSASTLGTVDESINVGSTVVGHTPHNGTSGSLIGSAGKHAIALEEVGMKGLANNFQFLKNPGEAASVIKWIPQLVTSILSS